MTLLQKTLDLGPRKIICYLSILQGVFVDYLFQLGLFAGKAFLIVLSITFILIIFVSVAYRMKAKHELEVEVLNEKYDDLSDLIKQGTYSKDELKNEKKLTKKLKKKEETRQRAFVIDFEGDIKASSVSALREEVSSILKIAKKNDQVIVRLESPGGMVHGYGLAASQLKRFREHGIRLVACVDKVAASGGYLMACTAEKILAAPFAIVGSVGVLAQVPNFNRLLKKHDIDYQEITSGEFKRTISLLGEITPEGRKKFQEEIVDTHALFKEFVAQCRPQVDVQKIGTGEHWFGLRALELKLIDEIKTSDEYIMGLLDTHQVIRICYEAKKKLSEKIASAFSLAVRKGLDRSVEAIENYRYL